MMSGMGGTELAAVLRNGRWTVRIKWANGKINFFGQFPAQHDSRQWIERHRWLTQQKTDVNKTYANGDDKREE